MKKVTDKEQMISLIKKDNTLNSISDDVIMLAPTILTKSSLKYASKRLRDNEEIICLAIEESYGLALCYASPRLKYKDNMIKQAIESPDVFPVGNFELYSLQKRAYIIGVLKEFVKGRENEPKHKRKKCKVLIKKH